MEAFINKFESEMNDYCAFISKKKSLEGLLKMIDRNIKSTHFQTSKILLSINLTIRVISELERLIERLDSGSNQRLSEVYKHPYYSLMGKKALLALLADMRVSYQ